MLDRIPLHVFVRHVLVEEIERCPLSWVRTLYRLAHVSRWCWAAVGSGKDVLERYRRRMEPYADMVTRSLCESAANDPIADSYSFELHHVGECWARFTVNSRIRFNDNDRFACHMSLCVRWYHSADGWRRQCPAYRYCTQHGSLNRKIDGGATQLRQLVHETLVYVLAGAPPFEACREVIMREAIAHAMAEQRPLNVKYRGGSRPGSYRVLKPLFWTDTTRYNGTQTTLPNACCRYTASYFVALDGSGVEKVYRVDRVCAVIEATRV